VRLPPSAQRRRTAAGSADPGSSAPKIASNSSRLWTRTASPIGPWLATPTNPAVDGEAPSSSGGPATMGTEARRIGNTSVSFERMRRRPGERAMSDDETVAKSEAGAIVPGEAGTGGGDGGGGRGRSRSRGGGRGGNGDGHGHGDGDGQREEQRP